MSTHAAFILALSLVPVAAAAQPVEVLHAFENPPSHVLGGLVAMPNGDLYGTTAEGERGGTIYRVTAGGGPVTIVARFDRGRYPDAPLTLGRDGLLYGTTRLGGAQDMGTIFRFDPATARITTLHALTRDESSLPTGRPLQAADGSWYITTRSAILRVEADTGRTQVLSSFGGLDGTPVGGLTEAPNGRFYGVLTAGGPGSGGTIYALDPATGAIALVHAFVINETSAWSPSSALTLTADGYLYGTTLRGGDEDAGTIYRLRPEAGAVEIVYALKPLAHLDGSKPVTRLVEAANGSLFGTTSVGSVTADAGTIFQLRRLPGDGHAFVTVAHLEPAVDGRGILTDLVRAADGWIYGGTDSGGPLDGGTVFRFDSAGRDPQGSVLFAVLHAFSRRGTGIYPGAPPISGADGALYGMTSLAGATLRGAVYRLDPSTGAATTLAPVPGSEAGGRWLNSMLVDGGDGSLYGTTRTETDGHVIRVTPATGAVSVMATVALPPFENGFAKGLVRAGTGLYAIIASSVVRVDPAAGTVTPVATLTGDVTDSAATAARDGRIYVHESVTGFSAFPFGPRYTDRLTRIDPGTGSTQVLLSVTHITPTPRAVAAVEGADGVVYMPTNDPAGAPLVEGVDVAHGGPTFSCTPGPRGIVTGLTAMPDGSVLVGVDTYARLELYRCARSPATPVLLQAWPSTIRLLTPFARGADGIFYGATDGGPAGGGAIVRFAADGALPPVDSDGDRLANAWEAAFGLDPWSAAGADGAGGDADGDGVTNLEEQAAGTHPRGTFVRYLAEGAANAFFTTRIAVINPGLGDAHVLLRFLTDDSRTVPYPLLVGAASRQSVDVGTIAGVAGTSFSTVVEADVPIGVERTMSWDATGYGSHTETAVVAPATTWYFAEGSTSGDFALFYLLQNPGATAVTATIRYLLPLGQPPIDRQYHLPAHSRTTIPVDADAALASTDVSAVVTATAPIIAERAMYLSRTGRPFGAGHASAGVTAPALEWFLAEGATGTFFDLFLLIANPNATPAAVTVDYLLQGGGTLTKAYTVPANARFTIWVDDEQIPAGSGQKPLASAAVSMAVRSTNGVPVIVERTMWWPGPAITPDFWYEAHNSPGATATARRWVAADGEVGGPDGAETYVLIANPSAAAGRALVRLYFENGNTTGASYDLPPHSRTNVAIGLAFPEAASNRLLGTVVESLGPDAVPIVVEHALYASPGGVTWTRGSNALATPLP